MTEIGGDFGEWSKDKIALQHAGVRDLECRSIDDIVAVEEDVEVDQARTVGERLAAAHVGFDTAKGGEELIRSKVGGGFERSVEEPRLVEITNGFRLVKTGKLRDDNTDVFEQLNGSAEVGFAIADVGAERDVDRGHEELIVIRRGDGRPKAWTWLRGVLG